MSPRRRVPPKKAAAVTALAVAPPTSPGRPAPSDSRREVCEQTYEMLVAGAPNERTRKNLANLRRALDHLVATKSPDFSVANVMRVRGALGLKSPQKSAIYNEPEGPFARLVHAYEAAYAPKKPCPVGGAYDDLVYAIPNEAVAQQVRWLVNENRSLKTELDAARAGFGKLRALSPRALLAHAQGELAAEPAANPFSEDEVAAVRRFLENADDLLPCEWDADTGALRLTRSGMQVAGPRFRQVLETIVAGTPSAPPALPAQLRLASPDGAHPTRRFATAGSSSSR